MRERPNTRLGVARLEELAPDHRHREGQPVHGFCLISGDGHHCRVTLYMENGRALSDRSGQGGFYYEGWLVGPEGLISLGAFNLGPGGQGSATRVLDFGSLPPARTERVRVTAEPFGGSEAGSIAVLEGRLVWLETGAAVPEAVGSAGDAGPEAPQVAAEPGAGWAVTPAMPEQAAREEEPVLQEATVGAGESADGSGLPDRADPGIGADAGAYADAPGVTEPDGPSAPLAPAGGEPAVPQAADQQPADGEPKMPQAAAEVADQQPANGEPVVPQPAAEVADQQPANGEPDMPQAAAAEAADQQPANGEPAMPPPDSSQPEPRHANPLELSVQLVQRHPMVLRAAGLATLNLRRGNLTLMLRGLPSPTALGRDRTTGRPFNAYRVWLVNQHTQMRTPVGFCQRAWGENFRFQGEGLPLHRHDTILITVEDRTASGMNTIAPQVLMGSYQA